MKDTKGRIIEAAVTLFNNNGYNQVSLRDIAAQAETTIGNLTYYFKQKEDLLIEIVEDLQTSYSLQFPEEAHGLELLEILVDAFISAQENEENNTFYYKNLYELTKDSAYIAGKAKKFQSDLYELVLNNLMKIQKDKVIKDSLNVQILKSFSYTFVGLSTAWLQQNMPYYNELIPQIPISSILCSLLKLYISEEYEVQYSTICLNKKIVLSN